MCDDHRDRDGTSGGLTRRGFIASVGAGAVTAASTATAGTASTEAAVEHGAMVPVELMVNRRRHRLLVEPRWSLLHVLRELLGLTGSKVGCERGECGACTVLIDDRPRYACMTLAVEAQGHAIMTVEGLMRGEELGDVQRAFVEEDALQCGYCTPGQIMSAEGLLRANPRPDEGQIREAMSGNLCRCAAYQHIVKAVARAARLRTGGER